MPSNITIDAAGRVVIPQRLRRALHLLPGTRLRIVEHGRGILIEPVESEPLLVMRDGVKLLGGTLDGPAPTTRELRETWLDEQTEKVTRSLDRKKKR